MTPTATRRLARGAPATAVAALLVALAVAPAVQATPQATQADTVTRPTDAMASEQRVVAAPRFEDDVISLADAVRLTLEYDPRIQTEKQELVVSLGILRQARGFFDHLIGVTPSFRYAQRELPKFLKDQEAGKRLLLETLASAFGEVAAALDEFLADDTQLLPPPCPAGLDLVIIQGGGVNILVGRDQAARSGLEFSDAFRGFPSGPGGDATDFFALCSPGTTLPSTRFFERINAILGLALNLRDVPRELVTLEREIAEAVATKAALAFERVGVVPKDLTSKTTAVQASWFRPWRSGIDTSVDISLRTQEQNFKDKSLDPAFGGLGVRNQFPSQVSVSFDVPLGKGRGRVSAAAPERAAEATVRARRDQLRHTMSEEVFGTVVAYINLVAAQQSLTLLEESAARQQQLVEITESLIEIGEVAEIERDRAGARASSVQRSVADARLRVLDAQFVLADAIGLLVERRDDAPLASDAFAESLVEPEETAALIDTAKARRRDLRAVTHLQDASEFLAEGARRDLARQIDFRITGGMSTLYESPNFKRFPGELDEPTEEPVRFNNPRGLFRSFDETWQPFVMASINVNLPFANNAAEGRFLQRQSSLRSSDIQRGNLERTIQDNVVDVAETLAYARRVVERRRETVGYYQTTLEATLAQYRDGEISLTDTILTEEELTLERLQLVRAMQVYLNLLARLRFEVGYLVTFDQLGTEDERIVFDPSRLVVR